MANEMRQEIGGTLEGRERILGKLVKSIGEMSTELRGWIKEIDVNYQVDELREMLRRHRGGGGSGLGLKKRKLTNGKHGTVK